MIKLTRVDHRLLHGQVAMTWTQSLGIDCILIANDRIAEDDMHKTILKLAKPNGVKLVIKSIEDSITALNSGVTDKYKLLIIVGSIEDAYRLSNKCNSITSINLGGCKPSQDTIKSIHKTIPISAQDEALLNEMMQKGIEIEIRQVPGDQKIILN